MMKLFLSFGLLWLVLKPIAAAAYGVQEIAIPAPDGALLRAIRISPPAAVARRPPIVALHGCSGLRGGADRPLSLPQRESDWAERRLPSGIA